MKILNVTTENVCEAGVYCIKDKKAPGFKAKVDWIKSKINDGLIIKLALDSEGKQLGFVEYVPSEQAWRPVKAENYYFIQCIGLFVKEARGRGIGSMLLKTVEEEARNEEKSGICSMSSDGPWMAHKLLFLKNGFSVKGKLGRFELIVKAIDVKAPLPEFIDWNKKQSQYKGWHLVYSDQCPWHYKSVNDIQQSAAKQGIVLTVTKLTTPQEAQNSPSGFGTFALIKDGKILSDHYLSKTRFESIIKKL